MFESVWFSLPRPTIFKATWGVKVNNIKQFDCCNLRDKEHCAILIPLGEKRYIYWKGHWKPAYCNVYGDLIIDSKHIDEP